MDEISMRSLDRYGMTDPGNNEEHTEDVCNVCDRRMIDHPGRERDGLGDGSAKWPHRIAALADMVIAWIGRRR